MSEYVSTAAAPPVGRSLAMRVMHPGRVHPAGYRLTRYSRVEASSQTDHSSPTAPGANVPTMTVPAKFEPLLHGVAA
jgi:hypothetical protein